MELLFRNYQFKKFNIMWADLLKTNKNLVIGLISSTLILLSGCKKEPLQEPLDNGADRISSSNSTESVNCQPSCQKTVTLKAGQHINVGTVYYQNSSNGNIEVTYSVNPPWKILSISYYIGNCSQIPKNSQGNPIPGQFPYKQTLQNGQSAVTIYINKNSVPTCGCIAAHATVKNMQSGATETAWGEGNRFTQTNWAMYYQYCLANCPNYCGYAFWYWFSDSGVIWPSSTLSIGGYTYSKAESIAIAHAFEYPESIPDAQKCFMQVCAAKLSAAHMPPNAPVWADVQICENYLSSLGQKLNPGFLPTGNENAEAAAARIDLWLKANPCIGK